MGFIVYNWKKTFALVPVTTVSNKRVWLKTVYKRRVLTCNVAVEPETQYSTLFDLLANR